MPRSYHKRQTRCPMCGKKGAVKPGSSRPGTCKACEEKLVEMGARFGPKYDPRVDKPKGEEDR